MSGIMFEGKEYKFCGTCKGNGYRRGYEHVQNGVCFHCDGEKSREVFNIKKERREAKARVAHIEQLKQEIARIYGRMNHSILSNSERYREARRREAGRAWKVLRELGETMTLEEIKERAEKIERSQ
jgi:hypothetical protein